MLPCRLLIIVTLAAVVHACGNRPVAISPDDEARVFMLVAGPSSQGLYNQAVRAADSILASAVMSDSLRGYIMIERDVALLNGGNETAAAAYADTLIAYGHRYGLLQAVSQGFQNKGVALWRDGRPDSAICCYREGMAAAVADADPEMEQVLADLLAVSLCETGNYADAEGMSHRALTLADELGDSTAMLSALSTLAAVYMRRGELQKVIDTLIPLYDGRQSFSPLHRLKYLTPLLHARIAQDSIPQAQAILAEIRDIAGMFPPTHKATVIYLTGLAELAGRQHRYADQWEAYCRIDSLGVYGKLPETVFMERADCLSALGRHSEATEMLRRAYAALDSTRTSALERNLADLSARYDTLARKRDIERLQQRGRFWGIVAAASFMLLLAGLSGALMWRKNLRRRHEISRQRQYINGLEQERGRIARELHDDIASEIVALQFSCDVTDAGKQLQERLCGLGEKVRLMSHELIAPEFSNYTFTQLLLSFVSRFNANHPDTRLLVTDEGSYDWNTLGAESSRELYRIIQEAVSNAVRHAAPAQIRITLDGDTSFRLSVANDIVPGAAVGGHDGVGARTLRARADILGATLTEHRTDSTYTLTLIQNENCPGN